MRSTSIALFLALSAGYLGAASAKSLPSPGNTDATQYKAAPAKTEANKKTATTRN
ncbi:hypothetical protein [Zobellella sp. DQSA1]|uniref:hypothetical protein n=1 Tax=Zobellella sp. DQSA1 TaxID=3342386 RepID=UPI0035C1A2E7